MSVKRNIQNLTKILLNDRAFKTSFLKNVHFLVKVATKHNYIIISLTEHLGDVIAAEPISRYIRQKYPNHKIVWFVALPYKKIIQANNHIDIGRTVTCFTEWIFLQWFIHKKKVYDLHISGKMCFKYYFKLVKPNSPVNISNYYHKGNLLYCFSRSAGIPIDPKEPPLLYVQNDFVKTDDEPYILLHTSANSINRIWNSTGWTELANYILTHYPDLKIIEVGYDQNIYSNDPRYVNDTGVKSLDGIIEKVRNCTFFIGLDSGFAHIANALQVESLILLGSLPNFSTYFPYSGFFYQQQDKLCIQYPSKLSTMEFSYIEPMLKDRLDAVFGCQ